MPPAVHDQHLFFAVRLMNRLRFRSKFGLAGALVALMVGVLALTLLLEMKRGLDVLHREQNGLVVLDASLDALEAIYRQQAIAAGAKTGSETLHTGLPEATAEADKRTKLVEHLLADSAEELELLAPWQALGQAATAAIADEQALPAFQATVRSYFADLGERSGLGLDAAVETHYLAVASLAGMSELVDRLSRLRRDGIVVLVQDELSIAEGRQLNLDLTQMRFAGEILDNLLNRAAAHLDSETAADELAKSRTAIAAQIEKLHRSVSSELLQATLAMTPGDYLMLFSAGSEEIIRHYRSAILPALQAGLSKRESHLQQRIWLGTAVTLSGFILLSLMAAGVFGGVLRSVRTLQSGAARLGSGDLAQRIVLDSSDELADVARSFNDMATAFGGVISEVQHSATKVMDAASSLSELAGQVSCGATQQNSAATQIAAAVEEMTSAIGITASNARQADTLSNESGRLSAEGGEEVGRSKEKMEHIAAVVADSERIIADLGDKLGSIVSMVDAINDIAEQTNLLALNASIEAARAGESGRGFAVVADEVRKLAERTAKATREIANLVDSIESGTERAVNAMSKGVAQVSEGLRQSDRASLAMQEIRQRVNDVVGIVSDISNSLVEQDTTRDTISRGIEQIAAMAKDNDGAVATLAETAKRMRDLSLDLQSQIQKFRA